MIITRKRFRLAAKWDRKDESMSADLFPRRQNANISWLLSEVLTDGRMRELERRGFDLNTVHFHIDVRPEVIEEYKAGKRLL